MNLPVEITLKYKLKENKLLGLMVDPFDFAEECQYVWQKCEDGTAKWEVMSVSKKNTFFFSCDIIRDIGNKYRCLVISGKYVKAYSRTLTINRGTFSANKEKATFNKQSSEKDKHISISDTDNMDGAAFELFCASILRENGFSKIVVTQEKSDYGIDILAEKESVSYAIQCKCYSSAVGNKAVQEAYSGKSFYNAMVAVVLTNNYFTNAAKETAKRNSVVLWDRNDLDRMITRTREGFDWRVFAEQEKERKAREERKWQGQTHREQDQVVEEQPTEDRIIVPLSFTFFIECTTKKQVKKRYRELAKKYHPDKRTGNEAIIKNINAQYEDLKKKFNII